MKKLLAVVVMLFVVGLALAQQPAKSDAVALTAADADKLQKALDAVNRQQTEFELARARYQTAIADFQRVKAEIIGDHGLAPTKHDFSPDGKSIIPAPSQAAVKKEPEKKP